jgi:hypothetical protein
MTKWSKEQKFSYKHPKYVLAKADLAMQEEFIEKYRNIYERNLYLQLLNVSSRDKIKFCP